MNRLGIGTTEFLQNCARDTFQAVLFHPLIYTKTLIQVGHEPFAPKLSRSLLGRCQLYYPGVFQYAKHIMHTDGVTGLYRGLAPVLMSGLVRSFVSVVVNTEIQLFLAGKELRRHDLESHSADASPANAGPLPDAEVLAVKNMLMKVQQILYELLSAGAGVILSHPFHVIAVRTMCQFVGKETKYCSVPSSVVEIWCQNGALGFFAGLAPRLIAELVTLFLSRLLSYTVSSYLLSPNFPEREFEPMSSLFCTAESCKYCLQKLDQLSVLFGITESVETRTIIILACLYRTCFRFLPTSYSGQVQVDKKKKRIGAQ